MLVHAGPFGNIAHGNSSIVADLIGIHGGDYLVTEAGFGADMGAERFFNIKCRTSGLHARRRGGRRHRAGAQGALRPPHDRRRQAAARGAAGREPGRGARRRRQPAQADREHPRCTASRRWSRINAFPDRPPLASTQAIARDRRVEWARGSRSARTSPTAGAGPPSWPRRWPRRPRSRRSFQLLYPDDATLREKIETVATKVYGADGVDVLPAANRQLDTYERNGFGHLPVCIAKTHLSISSDPTLKGAPTGWTHAGARGAGVGRRRVHLPDLRRHAHHARAWARTRRPTSSTSTRTGRSSACREPPGVLPARTVIPPGRRAGRGALVPCGDVWGSTGVGGHRNQPAGGEQTEPTPRVSSPGCWRRGTSTAVLYDHLWSFASGETSAGRPAGFRGTEAVHMGAR